MRIKFGEWETTTQENSEEYNEETDFILSETSRRVS